MSARAKKTAQQIVGLGGAFQQQTSAIPSASKIRGAQQQVLWRITMPGLPKDAPHPFPWSHGDQLCGQFASLIGSYAPAQQFGLESTAQGALDAWGTLGEWRSFLNCSSMGLPGSGGPMLPPHPKLSGRRFW